jgi:1-aminocyclopropane-1-carboxylate deaminase/D-cysteine desulfhydrase-like pyridoxal-dependent ACC family enzyme
MADAATRADLRQRLARLPRVPLGHWPTPLDDAPRLSAALGGPRLLVKRDDCTGLALGGNKTRQLELILGRALAEGCNCLVAGAFAQSNWCRQIAAAGAKLGLSVHLVLKSGVTGMEPQGNLLLDRLFGATITFVDIPDAEALTPQLEAAAARLAAEGRRPRVLGTHDDKLLAAAAYVEAMVELDEQMVAQGLAADRLYLSGADKTPAGCHLGMAALGGRTRVTGITPIAWEVPRPGDIAAIATDTARLLGLDLAFQGSDIDNDDGHIGARYGLPSPEGTAAMALCSRTEGLVLDPVYTAKAMAGLIADIRSGAVGPDETVVFLHTGGLPALFALADEVARGL